MVKQVRFEDWSRRFGKDRAKKAVEKLNQENRLTELIFPIASVISGLILLYIVCRLIWGV